MEYNFYGNSNVDNIINTSNIRPDIKNPKALYDALTGIWCRQTCAPRLQDSWSESNMTVGQCSITAFLCQDIFGGEVYGLKSSSGIHCYNVIDGVIFDLTSEQFEERAKDLVYDLSVDAKQDREMAHHFGKSEKRERYEYLKAKLLE